jgi:hypothetical protein
MTRPMSSIDRRCADLQAKRLGEAPPVYAREPIPARCLTPEFRLAKIREAQRLGLPAPDFGPGFSNKPQFEKVESPIAVDGRELPALPVGQEADAFLADHPGSFNPASPTELVFAIFSGV